MLDAFSRAPYLSFGKRKLVHFLLQNDEKVQCSVCTDIKLPHPLVGDDVDVNLEEFVF